MSDSIIVEPIKVTPEDLLLDPNNPRLVRDLGIGRKVEDKDLLKLQSELEDRFLNPVQLVTNSPTFRNYMIP